MRAQGGIIMKCRFCRALTWILWAVALPTTPLSRAVMNSGTIQSRKVALSNALLGVGSLLELNSTKRNPCYEGLRREL